VAAATSAARARERAAEGRSAILRHASTSSLSMTEDRYTHLLAGDLDQAKTALAAYLRAFGSGSENDTPDTRLDTRGT
jgi:uncharacterized protein YceH (UPF0502 family)